MIIRKAKEEESKDIAVFMMLAMEEVVYHFIGDHSYENAIYFLEYLIGKKETQYSYENCWVVEDNAEIVAVANVYDGAKLKLLREPVVNAISVMFNKVFVPEDETGAGEYYIDTLAVKIIRHGKGIGTKLLHFLIDEYVFKKNKVLGLLVDKENTKAKKLYLKLGFKIVGEKILTGKLMEHLQIK